MRYGYSQAELFANELVADIQFMGIKTTRIFVTDLLLVSHADQRTTAYSESDDSKHDHHELEQSRGDAELAGNAEGAGCRDLSEISKYSERPLI